jgi:hypothetical protein
MLVSQGSWYTGKEMIMKFKLYRCVSITKQQLVEIDADDLASAKLSVEYGDGRSIGDPEHLPAFIEVLDKGDCKVFKLSNRVCDLGTKGCEIRHGKIPSYVKDLETALANLISGYERSNQDPKSIRWAKRLLNKPDDWMGPENYVYNGGPLPEIRFTCEICGSEENIRKAPMMTGVPFDAADDDQKYVCRECVRIWYDGGGTSKGEILKHRKEVSKGD